MNKKNLFSVSIKPKASFFKRLFGGKNGSTLVEDLNDLLASKELLSITLDDIYGLTHSHNKNLRKHCLEDVLDIYGKYLKYCLDDKYLSEQEIEELKHLKKILMLHDEEVGKMHNKIAGEVYKMEVEKAVEDGRLSSDEKRFLRKLQNDLKLASPIATKIYQDTASDLLKKFMDEALSDYRLTEQEEEELHKIKQSLNIDIHLDSPTRANYEKYKLFWQIENGELPEFDVEENLNYEEKCHFYSNAEWLLQKSTAKKSKFSRIQLNSKLAKGQYFKTENKEMKPVLEDIWATMDNGRIYLTNQRLILSGNEKTITMEIEGIYDFSTYKNGINIIHKDKIVFLQFKDHLDIFSMVLSSIILNL